MTAPDPRAARIRAAYLALADSDRAVIDAQVQAVIAGVKLRRKADGGHGIPFGPGQALELLAMLGAWLVDPEWNR